MIGVGYIGIIDSHTVEILKTTNKTSNADWFTLDNIPKLAYDHNEILEKAIEKLKERIVTTDILKSFFPNGFTLPELQNVYESILNIKIDRRNFRKKMLSVIVDTGKEIKFAGKKKAKLYKFDKKKKDISIF
jgi:8-oxo-dGTP diphosphatase